MNYWSRDDTKAWVSQLEQRIEDISYFLDKTIEWCEDNYIYEDKLIFICSFLTCIWVSQCRGEPITYLELMEMLGISEVEVEQEKFYELHDKFIELSHIQLLEAAVKMYNESQDED